jgi:ribosomal protein S18 acetylase RimI-like enzyme
MDDLEFVPVSPDRWDDLARVMESYSNPRHCWCAYWYGSRAAYRDGWGEGNRASLEKLVRSGAEPGLLAYAGGTPAAWVSVAPREKFDALNRSKNFAALDDKEVWAVNCFVVGKDFRRQGLVTQLASAAAEFAISRGADGAEAYPMVPGPKTSAADLYVGTERAFIDAGYTEVARPLPRRPIMRRMKEFSGRSHRGR